MRTKNIKRILAALAAVCMLSACGSSQPEGSYVLPDLSDGADSVISTTGADSSKADPDSEAQTTEATAEDSADVTTSGDVTTIAEDITAVTDNVTEGSETIAGTAAPTETTKAPPSAATTAKKTTTTAKTTTAVTAKDPDGLVMKVRSSVEVGDDVKISSLITETNAKITGGSALIDTADIGQHTVKVSYTYGGKNYTKQVKYNVVDTTEPLLISGVWTVNLKTGNKFDLASMISYADNYDRKPKVSYSGKLDVNTPGTYNINGIIEDSSGNQYTWKIKVNVANSFSGSGSGGGGSEETPRISFSDFMKKYRADNVRFGIDVSKWQGDVDYNKVRDAGCEFVIMRIGSYYSEVALDSYFEKNIKNASAAGLDVGVYFYTTDTTEAGVREHARWIVKQLGGQKLDFPVAFDWESFSNFQQYEMSLNDLNNLYAAFADELEKNGYSAMLYGSKNRMNTVWSEKSKAAGPVWLAHYKNLDGQTDYDGDYSIWQASSIGRIPGINGDVDMDIQYLDMPI